MEKGKIPEPRLNIPIIPIFDPVEELNMYTSLGSIHSFAKGSAIVSPGNSFNYIIFVISGQLEVNLISANGTEKFMFKLYKNNIGMALFQDDEHEFQIIATDDSTVCFFTLDGIVEILARDTVLLKDFCLNLLQKANYFIMQSRDLYQSRPSSRILNFLYNLCLKNGKRVDDYYELTVDLSQKAIAKITGTHYVTVCKLFTYLRNEGIMGKKGKDIKVYDLDKLRDLIEDEQLKY